nr:immunoglobulin heavy chain junction region [Mus musculus]
CARSDGYFDYW